MSNQKLQVGDKVRCIDNTSYSDRLEENEVYTVQQIDNHYIHQLKEVEEERLGAQISRFEKVEEKDNIMKSDAITVEIDDDDLLEAIISKAENKYDYVKVGESDYYNYDYLYFGPQIEGTDKSYVFSVNKSESKYNFLGKLSENWNEVVGFLEQDNKLKEFKGYEVDYKPYSDEIEIGCKDFRVDNVINLYELMDEISLKEVVYGTITIKMDELTELVEYVRD